MSTRSRAVSGVLAFLLGIAVIGLAGVLVPGDPTVVRALGFGLVMGSVPVLVRAVLPRA